MGLKLLEAYHCHRPMYVYVLGSFFSELYNSPDRSGIRLLYSISTVSWTMSDTLNIFNLITYGSHSNNFSS